MTASPVANVLRLFMAPVRFAWASASSAGTLLVAAALLGIFDATHWVFGHSFPSAAGILVTIATAAMCASWVEADADSRRLIPCYDFGTFVFFTWIISVPWYLVHTRGPRGLLLVLALMAAWLLPFISTLVAAVSLQAFGR